jgi:hypothetical protein
MLARVYSSQIIASIFNVTITYKTTIRPVDFHHRLIQKNSTQIIWLN